MSFPHVDFSTVIHNLALYGLVAWECDYFYLLKHDCFPRRRVKIVKARKWLLVLSLYSGSWCTWLLYFSQQVSWRIAMTRWIRVPFMPTDFQLYRKMKLKFYCRSSVFVFLAVKKTKLNFHFRFLFSPSGRKRNSNSLNVLHFSFSVAKKMCKFHRLCPARSDCYNIAHGILSCYKLQGACI